SLMQLCLILVLARLAVGHVRAVPSSLVEVLGRLPLLTLPAPSNVEGLRDYTMIGALHYRPTLGKPIHDVLRYRPSNYLLQGNGSWICHWSSSLYGNSQPLATIKRAGGLTR